MKSSIRLILLISLISLCGCVSSDRNYAPPSSKATVAPNFKEVERSKDEVWNELVAGLGAQFFVINNMDKASGFINVSYSGDPEKYVDGGELYFQVENLRGPREYRFPGSKSKPKGSGFNV